MTPSPIYPLLDTLCGSTARLFIANHGLTILRLVLERGTSLSVLET